jgi:hypothetical protein
VRPLAYCAVLAAATRLPAQVANDTVFPLRSCASREPVHGTLRGDGIVAALLQSDGRIDTSSTRVLQVESMSIAGYRSAATRLLSTCTYRITGARTRQPLPVVISLAFGGDAPAVSSAEQVPVLDAGIGPGPVLIPTQDLPLPAEDRRIEESPMPDRSCTVWRDMVFTPVGRQSRAEYQRSISVQMAERRGRVRVGFELGADGWVVESSIDVTTVDNAKMAQHFLKTIKECRFAPARIGGVPVPVRMTLAASTAGFQ